MQFKSIDLNAFGLTLQATAANANKSIYGRFNCIGPSGSLAVAKLNQCKLV